jgi:hypothetical protein
VAIAAADIAQILTNAGLKDEVAVSALLRGSAFRNQRAVAQRQRLQWEFRTLNPHSQLDSVVRRVD